jgi:alpha-beta hydrolase superfamily lysophospholipase
MRTATFTPRVRQRLQTTAAIIVLSLGLTQCSDLPEEPGAPKSPESPPQTSESISFTTTCTQGKLPSGAPYEICVNPGLWNGDVVVFLPGYTNPAASPGTPSGDIGGLSAPDVVGALGFAWVTTGFRGTGLAVPDTWIDQDLLGLVETAKTILPGPIGRTYLTGGSQGGLITTLAVERHAQVFNGGGLAACGPIGSYRRQLEYVGDFRAVFDFYFDPVIKSPDWPVWTQSPPTNGRVDPAFWNATTRAAVASAIQARPARTANLLSVTRAPIDPANPAATTQQTVDDLLRYSFVGTNDAIAKLQGLAFSNIGRIYSGSTNDAALNRGVERFTFMASGAALQKLETTGSLKRPLVTIHTTGDQIVPIWQQSLYRNKTSRSLSSWLLHSRITVSRYGHCTFTPEEVLGAFALLVLKSTGQNLVLTQHALPEQRSRAAFLRAAREFGASPAIVTRGAD